MLLIYSAKPSGARINLLLSLEIMMSFSACKDGLHAAAYFIGKAIAELKQSAEFSGFPISEKTSKFELQLHGKAALYFFCIQLRNGNPQ